MGAIITEYRNVTITRGNKNIWLNNSMAIDKIRWSKKGIYTIGAIYANALTTDETEGREDRKAGNVQEIRQILCGDD